MTLPWYQPYVSASLQSAMELFVAPKLYRKRTARRIYFYDLGIYLERVTKVKPGASSLSPFVLENVYYQYRTTSFEVILPGFCDCHGVGQTYGVTSP
jgi:hypothetical protein